MSLSPVKLLNFFLVFLISIHLSNNAALSIYEQKKYKRAPEVQGLYSADDDVEIITFDNFKRNIYNSDRIWFLEFYNSWCGFCQRFAPSWKAFATDLKEWKDIIAIAALDCSNEVNYPVCRDFEIMAYPTLKYFHENYKESPKNLGEKLPTGTGEKAHKQQLLEKIILEQHQGRARNIPSLLPYTERILSNIFNNVPIQTTYAFLIIQDADSSIAQEVTLDLHKSKDFIIRYSFDNNTELRTSLKIETTPSLIALNRNTNKVQIISAPHTRQGIKLAIKQFLEPEHIYVPLSGEIREVIPMKDLSPQIPDTAEFTRVRERQELMERIKKMGDVIFQMDLEAALKYSLKHEVGIRKAITGEKLQALRSYLNVLAKYFPFGKYGQSFLVGLNHTVHDSSSIEGSDIAQLVRDAEKEERQVFSSPGHWLGCKGSSSSYRGYPCGLWKMFHYLTVNAADQNKDLPTANPREVLEAMHGYIKNYFGCAECSQHFQEMATRREMRKVASLDGSILWLWEAHNEVNNRLSGDPTEDPAYPKYQFPSITRCPQCYNSDNSFNTAECLKYLKHMYSNINVRYIGSDTRILHMGLEGFSAHSGSSSFFQKIDTTRVPEKDVRT